MALTKLTLSADPRIVKKARRLAQAKDTSISAMFSRYIESLEDEEEEPLSLDELGPNTRRALGMARLPPDKSDRELLEEALMEKYGLLDE